MLNPGTSASASYFVPLGKTVVELLPDWQVWAVERRENLLEDHSVLDQAKDGLVTGQELFDYYLGWLTDPSITTHFQFIADADVAFAREWGMRVEIEDLDRVVKEARSAAAARVVLGGHSLGGSITTAYATWDFKGKPGAKKLAGPRLHRRRQQPDPDHARAGDDRRSQTLADGHAVADVRRHPRAVRRPLQRDGLAGRLHRSGRAVDRPGVAAPAREPEAADPGHEHRAVRLRARHRDVAAEPDRGAGAPRPTRRERRPARLGPGGRDHADPALRRDVLRQGTERASTARRGTTRSA